MDKHKLLQKIVASLGENLDMLVKAAKASHAEATHESSRADNKYDTRGLEAAYLAGGQARQARDIQDAMELYAELGTQEFGAEDPIDLTALVELEANGASNLFFIGPKSGGLEVMMGKKEVTVITPQSPLGQNLMGRREGERWTSGVGGTSVKYKIIAVS